MGYPNPQSQAGHPSVSPGMGSMPGQAPVPTQSSQMPQHLMPQGPGQQSSQQQYMMQQRQMQQYRQAVPQQVSILLL